MDRRSFLNVLGLLTGSTALSACSSEKGRSPLISALIPPDDGVIPGQSTWHFTTCTECPAGCGMQVRLREGQPVKAEGIPDHPVSGGGLCVRGQASLWRLYHPKRLRGPLLREGGALSPVSWDDAEARILAALDRAGREGRRSAWLSGRTTGPLSELIAETTAALGVERLPEWEHFGHAAIRRANALLFGRGEVPRFDVGQPDVLLTVGADLLETFVNPVGFARQLADRPGGWWHAEPHLSLTGANADSRLALRPGSEPWLLAWLLGRVPGRAGRRLPPAVAGALPVVTRAAAADGTGLSPERLESLATALETAAAPLVLAGGVGTSGEGGLATAALAGLLQWTLGAVGRSVDLAAGENYAGVGSLLDLRRLADRLSRAEIGVLFVSRANPVLHAPADWALPRALAGATLRVGLGDVLDETLQEMDLVLPVSHALEAWGELEPRRGVRALLRPAIRPLGDTRTEGDLLLDLRRLRGAKVAASWQEQLFARWSARWDAATLAAFKERGVLEEPVAGAGTVALDEKGTAAFLRALKLAPPARQPALVFAPSIRRFDGRSRPLQLLDEVPDPLTTVTYGPWISVSPSDAARLRVADGEELRVAVGSWTAELPARLQPGLAAGVFVVQRDVLGSAPVGADPASGEPLTTIAGVSVERTGRKGSLPFLAGSPSQHGRGLIPDPKHRREKPERASLYPEHPHPDHRWGMAIDVDRCVGCGACVASCYVENNVAVTSAADHLRGREMSWLRIEPFYDAAGDVEFLPMLCQHCDYAPCEPVCPVYAAYHNPEGLNVQVYNRCIGTRYCSHNCPYKVRRFNWWTHEREAPLDRLRNPDLSVRTKGMMEKCTFCIQRIRAAKELARDEGRPVRDGDVVTACEQSCPTAAIVFGDMNDPTSRVVALAAAKGAWRVFEELGTEPSVRYLRSRSREGEG
jgi:Fe-S-cluster-containing dehydrogenase component/anaerobic selenocysteine-containing dehydrogenase